MFYFVCVVMPVAGWDFVGPQHSRETGSRCVVLRLVMVSVVCVVLTRAVLSCVCAYVCERRAVPIR